VTFYPIVTFQSNVLVLQKTIEDDELWNRIDIAGYNKWIHPGSYRISTWLDDKKLTTARVKVGSTEIYFSSKI